MSHQTKTKILFMPMQEGREEKNNNNKEGKAELGDTQKVLSTKI